MADGDTSEAGNRVTIRTVAADAGVSVAAVSKVMRNAYGVSDALRLKVEASIEKLGYRPSVAARGMRGRTFTLGVLLVGIDNPFPARHLPGHRKRDRGSGLQDHGRRRRRPRPHRGAR